MFVRILSVILIIFSHNLFANIERHQVVIDGNLVVFYDSNCSETSYCADGFTTNGIDRLGNPRGYVYPKTTISYEEYRKAFKSYGHEGYNQYGFDREDKNRNGILAKYAKIEIVIHNK